MTLCMVAAVILISLAGRCEGAAPYLAVESNNGVTVVTWTNMPEVRLLESTNLVDWVPSSRPFHYFGGYYRLRIFPTEARRFYRLAGSTTEQVRLGWESEFEQLFLRWPFPSESFVLQTRPEVHTGEWAQAGAGAFVFRGYKRFQVPDDGTARYYRLSRPLNHVLIVGQSLAVGVGGADILSTNQPYQNKMFTGQQFDGAQILFPPPPDDLSGFVPLMERYDPWQATGETIASGFANSISFWAGVGEHDMLMSNAGRGSAGYEQLKQGTDSYARGTNQIAAGKALAQDLGYRFQAVFAVHGEADSINQHYDTDIREWQAHFSDDVRRQTGQMADTPMFHSQISTFGGVQLSPLLTLAEHEANPDKTVLVGPKYFLPYTDGLHLNSVGYQWLGEYYAKAYRQHVINGVQWSPLRPVDIVRTNEFITVTFTGNVGSLVWDTNLVTDPQRTFYVPVYGPSVFIVVDPVADTITFPTVHQLQPGDPLFLHGVTSPGGITLDGLSTRYFVRSISGSNSVTISTSTNGPSVDFTSTGTNVFIYLPKQAVIGPYGFEYFEDAGSGIPWRCATEIVSAEIISSNQVRLQLSQPPTAGYRRLSYAHTAPEVNLAGPITGRRGNLRDSDPATSLYGRTLYNWCVHFDKPVP